jgi:hypothetical protein
MELDISKNYIVSGLERSGTSMLMQILYNGGYPVESDEKRQPDENNPKGYFELEGGKIINKLMERNFPFDRYKGKIIKITAYGLKYLPQGDYVIIYSERNIEEILDSMEKMAQITDENRAETKDVFLKLNSFIKEQIAQRSDCNVLFVNYNEILTNPSDNIKEINDFLHQDYADLQAMIRTVDEKLYRNRKVES